MKAVLCPVEPVFSNGGFPDGHFPLMPKDSRRLLIRSVLASLLAHLLLVVGAADLWPTLSASSGSGSRALLRGTIVERAPMGGAQPLASVERREMVPLGRAAGDGRLAAARPMPRDARSPTSSRSAGQALPMAAVSVERPGAKASAQPGEATEGLDADDVRQYRFSLALAARRFKPGSTADAGGMPSGSVEIAVSGYRGEALAQVVMHRSSGVALLDEQAVIMMKQAAGVAPLPDRMRGRDFRIVIRLLFGTEEDAGR